MIIKTRHFANNDDIKFIIRSRNENDSKLIGALVGLKSTQITYIQSLVIEPLKTAQEQELFNKWKIILQKDRITKSMIKNYRKDLETLTLNK